MKKQDLQAKAKQLGISSFGKTKKNLIREIQRREGNFDCFGTATDYCDQFICCFRSLCLENGKSQKKRN